MIEVNTIDSLLKKYVDKFMCINVRFLKTLAVFSWPGWASFRLDPNPAMSPVFTQAILGPSIALVKQCTDLIWLTKSK